MICTRRQLRVVVTSSYLWALLCIGDENEKLAMTLWPTTCASESNLSATLVSLPGKSWMVAESVFWTTSLVFEGMTATTTIMTTASMQSDVRHLARLKHRRPHQEPEHSLNNNISDNRWWRLRETPLKDGQRVGQRQRWPFNSGY